MKPLASICALGSPRSACYKFSVIVGDALKGFRITGMGERPLVKLAIVASLALAVGPSAFAPPAAAQSLTDRVKSLFGGKPDTPPPAAPSEDPQPDISCPPVGIRAGASTYTVAASGKQPVGDDVRFQVTITKTARECIKAGSEITAHIGIQGRIIAGPAGAPSTVEVPIRIAVVQGGVGEKVIATKAYRTTVEMTEDGVAPYSLVADDLVYPAPVGGAGDQYIFYIGFDPTLVSPEPKAKPVKKKKG
jgi:hypothetical protein